MKTFTFTVAVIYMLAFILIKNSFAWPSTQKQNVPEVRDGDVFEAFQMQSEQEKMSDFVRDRHKRDERDCRLCCNCCRMGPTWCGLCCEW
ncbi:hepcidin-like [Corythoichthys intestinalis]|uniref:hepcidin-like n=1 Tax=Corythoichthys intestinalis TaxID=161448 RepID=UPI0025A51924|nr:hepcidin-like [Corythoichthys intestinalis]